MKRVKLRFRPENQITVSDGDRPALSDITSSNDREPEAPVSEDVSHKRLKDASADDTDTLKPPTKKQRTAPCKKAGILDSTRWTKKDLVALFTELFGPEHDEMFDCYMNNKTNACKKVSNILATPLSSLLISF